MIGGIEETSASFEARSAPRSYPTPIIGHLHAEKLDRPALVFDLMEPLRPIVDRKVLEFVRARTFHPADFTIRPDGVCRLNPEMAKWVVRSVAASLEPTIVDC